MCIRDSLGLVMKASLEDYDQREVDGGDGRYLSPELMLGDAEQLRGVLHKSDMWALGCTVYAMARRAPIPTGEEFERLQQGHFSVSGTEYTQEFVQLLKRLIDPNPHTRISATELLNHPLLRPPWELKYQAAKAKKRKLQRQLEQQQDTIASLRRRVQQLESQSNSKDTIASQRLLESRMLNLDFRK